jgi:uncharacterized protein YhfF
MPTPADFFLAYLNTLPEPQRLNPPHYEVCDFGNTKVLADSIGLLVKQGIKTTTSMLACELENTDEKPPYMGEIDVVTDGNGEPLCIIETVEIEVRPFNTIDAQFAYHYGEGDCTLEWWMREMWAYYVEDAKTYGCTATETMPLVCIRFKLLYPPIH